MRPHTERRAISTLQHPNICHRASRSMRCRRTRVRRFEEAQAKLFLADRHRGPVNALVDLDAVPSADNHLSKVVLLDYAPGPPIGTQQSAARRSFEEGRPA